MDPTHVDNPIVVGDQSDDAETVVCEDEASAIDAQTDGADTNQPLDQQIANAEPVTGAVVVSEVPVESETDAPETPEEAIHVADAAQVPAEEQSETAPEEQSQQSTESSRPDAEVIPVRVVINGIAQRVPEIDVTPRPQPEAVPASQCEPEKQPVTQPEPQPVPEQQPVTQPEPQPVPEQQPATQPETSPTPKPKPAISVAEWIGNDRVWRNNEIAAFRRPDFMMETQIGDDRSLTRPFKVQGNVFLLYYAPSFPSPEFGGACPVRVYLVAPSIAECKLPRGKIPFTLKADDAGMVHISDRMFESDYYRVVRRKNGRASFTMADAAIDLARRWSKSLAQWSATARDIPPIIRQPELRNNTFGKKPYKGGGPAQVPATGRPNRSMQLGRALFLDGRRSQGLAAPEKCHKIVFSDRAFAQIYTETQARITTETGGLLLGHFHEGVWYVIEACDPGWNGVFQAGYHEGDERYENHVSSILARLYRFPLVFLGMWHRHPGSLDTFSGTDDVTNWQYVDICTGAGCISGLINYDPEFRMTFYHCEHTDAQSMRYTRVDIEVGDDKFVMPEMLAMASKADVDSRDWR